MMQPENSSGIPIVQTQPLQMLPHLDEIRRNQNPAFPPDTQEVHTNLVARAQVVATASKELQK
jgi:hypothetical protein